MKVIFLGYRLLDFVPKEKENGKDPKPVVGTKIYFAHIERNVVGMITGTCFVPIELSEMICFNLDDYLNQPINAEFNTKGKVVALTVFEKAA